MGINRIVIGISGCSASGKSFIVKYILDNLGDELVSILYQDNYYRKREDQIKDDKGNYNFDLPTSFHIDQQIDDIKKICYKRKFIQGIYRLAQDTQSL